MAVPLRTWLRAHRVRSQARIARPLRVIIGAGPTVEAGWISTDQDVLDITSETAWQRLFELASIDRLLSEHVLEHLTEEECRIGLRLCLQYLRPGGVFRIAVPDDYRDDEAYRKESAPPNYGHRQFLNVDTLTALLIDAGYEVTPLEYFDVSGQFHGAPWDRADGMIQRSARFDKQVAFRRGRLYYTSLIVDARRPT